MFSSHQFECLLLLFRRRVRCSEPTPYDDASGEHQPRGFTAVYTQRGTFTPGPVFELFLKLMPNITSLTLERSPQTLDSALVLRSLQGLNQPLEKLELITAGVDEHTVISMLELYSSSLRKLRIDYAIPVLTERAFWKVAGCTNLRGLALGSNTLGSYSSETASSLARKILRNNPNLEYFESNRNIRTSEVIESSKHLRKLSLRPSEGITKSMWCEMAKLSSLQCIIIKRWKCDPSVFLELAHLPNLKALILENSNVTPKCFAVICESIPNLDTLELSDCRKLTDKDGVNFRRLKKLRSLQIRSASGLTELTFDGSVGSSALETLSVLDSTFSDVALRNIATHHPHLRFVHFGDCNEITDAGLQFFLRSEPLLERIILENCAQVTDQSLEAISGAPLLRHLKVTGAKRCGADAVTRFRERRPLVKASIVTARIVHVSTFRYLGSVREPIVR